jgi:hypothetical protein
MRDRQPAPIPRPISLGRRRQGFRKKAERSIRRAATGGGVRAPHSGEARGRHHRIGKERGSHAHLRRHQFAHDGSSTSPRITGCSAQKQDRASSTLGPSEHRTKATFAESDH